MEVGMNRLKKTFGIFTLSLTILFSGPSPASSSGLLLDQYKTNFMNEALATTAHQIQRCTRKKLWVDQGSIGVIPSKYCNQVGE